MHTLLWHCCQPVVIQAFVDEGRQIFCAMKDYGVEPTVVHYTCMGDLLGRAGLLEETKRFISSMPVGADADTWGAFVEPMEM